MLYTGWLIGIPYDFLLESLYNWVGFHSQQTPQQTGGPFFVAQMRELSYMLSWESKVIQVILLMEEILHQLISSLSDYLQGFIHPTSYRVSINSTKGCIYMQILM